MQKTGFRIMAGFGTVQNKDGTGTYPDADGTRQAGCGGGKEQSKRSNHNIRTGSDNAKAKKVAGKCGSFKTTQGKAAQDVDFQMCDGYGSFGALCGSLFCG